MGGWDGGGGARTWNGERGSGTPCCLLTGGWRRGPGAAGGAGGAGEGGLRLDLGAGSESGNVALPLSGVGQAETGSGGGGVALSRLFRGFPVPAELSQLFPGARRRRVCSRRGAEVQSRAAGLSLPSWSRREQGPRDPAFLLRDPWDLSTGPLAHDHFVCLRCKSQGLRQIMGLNEEGA